MNMVSPSASNHRLPVYLIVDTSASMYGQAAEAFKQGIKYVLTTLKNEDFAGDIHVGLISFNCHAARDIPLVPLEDFAIGELELGGASRFSELIQLLHTCVQDDLVPPATGVRGDYKALVFIFTDGCFTDQWMSKMPLIQAIRQRCSCFVAIGCGSHADYDMIGRITPDVIRIDSYQPGDINDYVELSWL